MNLTDIGLEKASNVELVDGLVEQVELLTEWVSDLAKPSTEAYKKRTRRRIDDCTVELNAIRAEILRRMEKAEAGVMDDNQPRARQHVRRTFQPGQEEEAARWTLAGPDAGEDRQIVGAPGFGFVECMKLIQKIGDEGDGGRDG